MANKRIFIVSERALNAGGLASASTSWGSDERIVAIKCICIVPESAINAEGLASSSALAS